MNTEARIIIKDDTVVIELGKVNLFFFKPTRLDKDQMEVVVLGLGPEIAVTVNSKTVLGALKALEANHDKRRVREAGREQWQSSSEPQQSLA